MNRPSLFATLKQWMQDDVLHKLDRDPDFDTRSTIPAAASDTMPCPPPEGSIAPSSPSDDFEDGWL